MSDQLGTTGRDQRNRQLTCTAECRDDELLGVARVRLVREGRPGQQAEFEVFRPFTTVRDFGAEPAVALGTRAEVSECALTVAERDVN